MNTLDWIEKYAIVFKQPNGLFAPAPGLMGITWPQLVWLNEHGYNLNIVF